MTTGCDYDWIVIGSGFGGSVSALRLAEKGYRVAVIECGRRFEDHEFARAAVAPAPLDLAAQTENDGRSCGSRGSRT